MEEAAEVLEAHILTSMAPSTEQLILIGAPPVMHVDTPRCSRHPFRSKKMTLEVFDRTSC